MNDAKNGALYEQYREKAAGERNVIFGGRLGQYLYLDMDDTLRAAIDWKSACLPTATRFWRTTRRITT